MQLGADYIATGHYARIRHDEVGYHLLKGVDANKDQSYFLYTLGQQQLQASMFPLGGLNKSDVRTIAERAGFPNHAKKDSTGICFIGERKFKDFLERYLPAQPGEIHTTEGQCIGTHHGLMYYTLGQRKGLGIGGTKDGTEAPWYTVSKDLERNILIVAQGQENSLLYHNELEASQLHWTITPPQTFPFQADAKVRYRQEDQDCEIIWLENNRCRVRFSCPQRAITPGQSVVFYKGDECLGGGIIESMTNV